MARKKRKDKARKAERANCLVVYKPAGNLQRRVNGWAEYMREMMSRGCGPESIPRDTLRRMIADFDQVGHPLAKHYLKYMEPPKAASEFLGKRRRSPLQAYQSKSGTFDPLQGQGTPPSGPPSSEGYGKFVTIRSPGMMASAALDKNRIVRSIDVKTGTVVPERTRERPSRERGVYLYTRGARGVKRKAPPVMVYRYTKPHDGRVALGAGPMPDHGPVFRYVNGAQQMMSWVPPFMRYGAQPNQFVHNAGQYGPPLSSQASSASSSRRCVGCPRRSDASRNPRTSCWG